MEKIWSENTIYFFSEKTDLQQAPEEASTFSFFGTIFWLSGVRIPNPDPDLLTHYNLDPIRVPLTYPIAHVRILRTGLTYYHL